MSTELLTLFLFASLLGGIALGIPIVFILGGVGVIFTYFLFGSSSLYIIASITIDKVTDYSLLAIPLFVFMAYMLERSGVAEDLYSMMHLWLGRLRGGLAIGTVWICTIIAAMSGISGVGTITMGLIALPAMLKRNYDKKIALGCIPAGGALGALIPPSLAFILYGIQAEVSIGKLYAGGILPGLLLSLLFSIYIGIRCYLKPDLGPALHEGMATWQEKFASLKAVILPLLIVIAVLGSIFTGFATVTESASIGALGTIISAAIYRKLNWEMVKKTCYTTLKLTSMVTFILIGASLFTSVYTTIRGEEVVQDLIMKIAIGRWGVIIIIQFIFFILGCLLDPASIILICTPIFVPLITKLGFDPLWFGILFVVNMEMGYLTPPFGMALFILRGVVPKEITTLDIYHSIVPFVGLQALGLVIIMIFPQIGLILPRLIFK